MKITVVGSGYVGLTTALSFSSQKHKVLVYDLNKKKIKDLDRGVPAFHENGLQKLLKKQIKKKKYIFY